MKREFLEKLGLEKEAIDKIMAENGTDIENAKKAYSDYDDIKGQLKTATDTIADLKKNGGDVEKLNSKIKEYETTIQTMQKDAETKAFNYQLDTALKDTKCKSVKALKALLDMEKIKQDGSNLLGLDDQIKALKESDGYLFENTEQEPPKLESIKPTNTDVPGGDTLRSQIAEAIKG